MQLKCRLNQAKTSQIAAKKPQPSRRKPPKSRLGSRRNILLLSTLRHIGFVSSGRFLQPAKLSLHNRHDAAKVASFPRKRESTICAGFWIPAFAGMTAKPYPLMPAISRHDFLSQTESDSANRVACAFLSRKREKIRRAQRLADTLSHYTRNSLMCQAALAK